MAVLRSLLTRIPAKRTLSNEVQGTLDRKWRWLAVGAFVLVLIFTAVVRIRVLNVPFERDEGEYAYMGRLILDGVPPYKLAYNMKLPGIYAAYALVMAIFGQTGAGVHAGALVVNLATAVLVFCLGRRLFGTATGAVAGICFALLTLNIQVQGIWANAEHFLMLPAIGGVLLLVKALQSGRRTELALSGLLLGVAIVVKQHAAFYAVFAALYLLYAGLKMRPMSWRRIASAQGLFWLGMAIPYIATCLWMFGAGVFPSFWFWTVQYARQYTGQRTLMENLPQGIGLAGVIVKPALVLSLLGVLGLLSPMWDRKARMHWVFVFGFFLFSFLAIFPGYYFRQHYFMLIIPALSLLVAVALGSLRRLLLGATLPAVASIIPALLLAAGVAHTIYMNSGPWFLLDMNGVSRYIYGRNPFPEAVEIASYIEKNTDKDDRIAILGSEPQILFYAGRRSSTGFIYMYPLVEVQAYAKRMQCQMIGELNEYPPEYIVFVNTQESWTVQSVADVSVFKWFKDAYENRYQVDGVIDIGLDTESAYWWGEEARYMGFPETHDIYILRRRSPGDGASQ